MDDCLKLKPDPRRQLLEVSLIPISTEVPILTVIIGIYSTLSTLIILLYVGTLVPTSVTGTIMILTLMGTALTLGITRSVFKGTRPDNMVHLTAIKTRASVILSGFSFIGRPIGTSFQFSYVASDFLDVISGYYTLRFIRSAYCILTPFLAEESLLRLPCVNASYFKASLTASSIVAGSF